MRLGRAIRRDDLGRDLGRRRIDIGHDHMRALTREGLRDAAADPCTAPVISAILSAAASDRPPVPEAPICDAW